MISYQEERNKYMKLTSGGKVALGGTLGTAGAAGMVFSILFGQSLCTNPAWVIGLFLIGVTTCFGAVLAVFGLYERRKEM